MKTKFEDELLWNEEYFNMELDLSNEYIIHLSKEDIDRIQALTHLNHKIEWFGYKKGDK